MTFCLISCLKAKPEALKDSGFSLLELLIVLAIMSVMLSIAGTRVISSIESARFARTVDAAIANIRLIRADAMLKLIFLDLNNHEINGGHCQYLKAGL